MNSNHRLRSLPTGGPAVLADSYNTLPPRLSATQQRRAVLGDMTTPSSGHNVNRAVATTVPAHDGER